MDAGRPLSDAPLEGLLVRLVLMTPAEAGLMALGRRLPGWAEGYPRQDDVDAAAMVRESPAAGIARWGPRHVIRRSDGLVVGSIGFFGPPDEDGLVEVGYGLVESARGQGLAREALELAVAAAEASGATVQAHTASGNGPSRRVLQRAGFVATGERNVAGELRHVRPRPTGA